MLQPPGTIFDDEVAAFYDPSRLSITCTQSLNPSLIHEFIHHVDCTATPMGHLAAVLQQKRCGQVFETVKEKTLSGAPVQIPVSLDLFGTPQIQWILDLADRLNGSPYDALNSNVLWRFSTKNSMEMIGRDLAWACESNSLHGFCYIRGKDLSGQLFSFRPGILHLLESRAQLGNMYYLMERYPDDAYVLNHHLARIEGPSANAYSILYICAARLWKKHIQSEGGANLYGAIYPIALLALVALYTPDNPNPIDDVLYRLALRKSDPIFPSNVSSPMLTFMRLAEAARDNWLKGSWDDFPVVYEWLDQLCKQVAGITFTERIRQFVIMLRRMQDEPTVTPEYKMLARIGRL